MASNGRHGKPDEEMFLQKPAQADSPTIEPLRIFKRESRSPEPSLQHDFAQNAVFPLPPGASSSPAPLPYPDDRQNTGQRPSNARMKTGEPTRLKTAGATSQLPVTGLDTSRAGFPNYPPSLRPQHEYDGQTISRLAERRGNVPKPLPDSPGPEAPDKEGLFQKMPHRDGDSALRDGSRPVHRESDPYPEYYQQYWPPPGESAVPPSSQPGLTIPQNGSGVNRLSSTASTSTTKAQRGSPPPPETPVVQAAEQPGGGIEARYAAAGIAGASTLTNLQAQNAAAAQRSKQYSQTQTRPEPARRWTPTEQPGTQPHGPPTVYQGPGQASQSPPIKAPIAQGRILTPTTSSQPGRSNVDLEQDIQRMNISHSPPPAYTPASAGTTTMHGFPNEKQNPQRAGGAVIGTTAGQTAPDPAAAATVTQPSPQSSLDTHPAFANDPRPESSASQRPTREDVGPSNQANTKASATTTPAGVAAPPPLPEGWIAHMDPNSGQYYYIHLPTQSTQWEFPKGPTPLNLHEPLSPTGSINFHNTLASPGLSAFSGKPLASPGFQPSTPGYPDSIMSATPTLGGFSGPPPTAGVDMYKIHPTNGVYFGPYLRYTNMDLERGIWLGSILLVTDALQPPTIHIHQSTDLSPNPRQLKANSIFAHQRWTFYRYDVDLRMEDDMSAKWTYAITSHLGCTRYEFLVASRKETSWRFIATSGNDFSLNVNANDRTKIGGIGYIWKDIMQKHVECGGFHTQLGLGDQIYADRIWKEVPLLKQWLAMSGKENRKNAQWTAKHEEDVSHAYFHYYTSHFDQPYLREAFAQIPHILQIDDHDMYVSFSKIANC